jgi:hypothetical protein
MMSCEECGYVWASPPRHVVATVEVLSIRLSQLVHEVDIGDDDARLRTRPAPAAAGSDWSTSRTPTTAGTPQASRSFSANSDQKLHGA